LDALIDADLAGKIALFHSDLISEPLSPKSWFLKSERDDAIIDALETKDPAALLTPPPPMPQYEQFTGDWALEVPAATVSGGVAERLLRDEDVAHLRLICRKYPATARNIVARRRGVGPASDPLDKVVLMAHFDTRINTPGALDNGGGVAALLCLAEALVEERSPFDLEFVAFNGEEYLPMGDDEYVRRAGEAAFERIRLAVNMDGIGLREGQNTITQFNVPPAMLERLKKITQCYPAVAWVEPWPESNHSTFAFRGVPSVALSSQGARNVSHYRTDTMDKVDTQKLVEIVKLVQEAVRTAD
jgi:Iap family predicted aminopeptidase